MNKEDELTHELGVDEFLSSKDLVIEKVPTPEIRKNSFIYVQSLSAFERGQIDDGAARYKEGKNKNFARDFSVRLVFLGACDKNGKRLFTKEEQVISLRDKNSAMISRIAQRVSELSGLSKKEFDELAKNSTEAQLEDSPSV